MRQVIGGERGDTATRHLRKHDGFSGGDTTGDTDDEAFRIFVFHLFSPDISDSRPFLGLRDVSLSGSPDTVNKADRRADRPYAVAEQFPTAPARPGNCGWSSRDAQWPRATSLGGRHKGVPILFASGGEPVGK